MFGVNVSRLGAYLRSISKLVIQVKVLRVFLEVCLNHYYNPRNDDFFREKYMVLETHITEIWDLPGNEKNIICFMHYLLFIFTFSKLPFRSPCQQAKKKKHFFLFSLGVLHGFSQKSNDDEYSWKSNRGDNGSKKKIPVWSPKKIHPPFDFRENSSSFDFRENPCKTPKENKIKCFFFSPCVFWIYSRRCRFHSISGNLVWFPRKSM